MKIGVAYYPEQWPEDRWPADARLMAEMGVDFVRLGDFAWSHLEPRRLQYDMAWLGRAMDVLAAEGLGVVLCTPTAAPPAWLFVRHPSMKPADAEGKPWFPGSRRHACLNNRPYRRYARRIVREMARNFAARPEVVAWQIDNQLGSTGSGECYCDDCEQAFREWLQRRYGMIDRLNKLWGTAFWSQRFNDWHEITAPRRTPEGPHPSLALDYKRFMTAAVRDFITEQRELIEQYSPDPKPITTNSLPLFASHQDQFTLGGAVDVAAISNYPGGEEALNRVALQLDLIRSAKGRRFWALEQQAGPTTLRRRRSQPRPGQLRLWSFQAAARGADALCYFRWRTAHAGQEMHWYGLLEPDGTQARCFGEVRQTIADLKAGARHWEGLMPDARAAILLDYHSHWALQADSMAADLRCLDQAWAVHDMLRRRGLAVDFLPPEGDPAPYRLVVAPMPVIAHERMAAAYEDFAARGGVLLVTAPAGYRTEQNTWQVTPPPPGPLTALLGVQVVEHDLLGRGERCSVTLNGVEFSAVGLCLSLQVQDAEAVGAFGPECYPGRPAVTQRRTGAGSVWFIATVPERDLLDGALTLALDAAGLTPHAWAMDALEIVPLRSAGGQAAGTFVMNHGMETVRLPVPDGLVVRDLLTGREHGGELTLEPCGVVLLAP